MNRNVQNELRRRRAIGRVLLVSGVAAFAFMTVIAAAGKRPEQRTVQVLEKIVAAIAWNPPPEEMPNPTLPAGSPTVTRPQYTPPSGDGGRLPSFAPKVPPTAFIEPVLAWPAVVPEGVPVDRVPFGRENPLACSIQCNEAANRQLNSCDGDTGRTGPRRRKRSVPNAACRSTSLATYDACLTDCGLPPPTTVAHNRPLGSGDSP